MKTLKQIINDTENQFTHHTSPNGYLPIDYIPQIVEKWLMQKQQTVHYQCTCITCKACEEGYQEAIKELLEELKQ